MTRLRGRVLAPDADLPDAVVVVEGDRVAEVRPAIPDDEPAAEPCVILPGLVDTHCHGGGGASLTSGDPEQVRAAAAHHLSQGTTTLVGSVVTDRPERMLAAVAALADAADAGAVAAIHVEGPFLSAARCGAQDPAWLREPDLVLAEKLVAAGRGHVRTMTLAPELPGAFEVADRLRDGGVLPALGHTEASSETARAFLGAGAPGLVTHLFNGMPPIHHRDPGPALGALAAAREGAVLELVADGVHLADATVAGVVALVGATSVVLVTDAMAAAGMPDGDYTLGPQAVRVRDGIARLAEGSSIAGGTARLLDVVRRHLDAGALDPVDVVACASSRAAAVLGLDGDLGSLTPGLRADLVVADTGLRPRRVMRAGAWVG